MTATYFDHNATTPVDPRVKRSMEPWLTGLYGNPSSIHAFGRRAREAVEAARHEVGRMLAADPVELVFTASGTEANNTVLRGVTRHGAGRGHLVVSQVEHPSVEVVARALERDGTLVTWVPPDSQGRIDPAAVEAALRDETTLVALVLANNVVGTVQPVAEVADLCRRRGVPLLCDAVQAVGKLSVHVEDLGADYLTLGAHKFYGPPGAAALWIRRGTALDPLLLGGMQERRRRAGTENVAAIVGMGEAARLAASELDQRRSQLARLRDRFEEGIGRLSEAVIHGRRAERLPNTSHVAFTGIDSQALLIRLDLAGFAVSAGSACSSGTIDPSRTLLAMGVTPEEASSAIRVSFGISNTVSEVDRFLTVLEREVDELRRLAAVVP